MIIEASAFLIDHYDIDHGLLDLIIIVCVCLLPSVAIFSWFRKKFSWWSVTLYALNLMVLIIAMRAFLLNPLYVKPNDLRLIRLTDWESKEFDQGMHSIAVLPIINNAGINEFEYLIAGIHDGLVSEIGLINNFRVISRTSTLPYKKSGKSIQNIANELRVKSVMEATLNSIGDQVELSLKLFNAFPEEKMIWSATYESPIGELPNLYKKVTRSVANELAQRISPAVSKILNENKSYHPDAYEAYLKGIYHTSFLTNEGFGQAETQYLNAIQIDSVIAPMAYGELSLMWISIRQMGQFPILEATKKANYYFNKQIEADSTSRIGEPALRTWLTYEWGKAEKAWKSELGTKSNDAEFRSAYAHYLMIMGRWDEAWENMNYALVIDPLNPRIIAFSGAMYMYEGKIISAQKKFELLSEIAPDHPMALQGLFAKYHTFGEERKAIEQLKKYFKIELRMDMDEFIDQTFSNEGYKKGVEIIADEMFEQSKNQNTPLLVTMMYRLIGQNDKTIACMERMYKVKDGNLPYFAIKDGSEIQKDPRYIAIMERIGLW